MEEEPVLSRSCFILVLKIRLPTSTRKVSIWLSSQQPQAGRAELGTSAARTRLFGRTIEEGEEEQDSHLTSPHQPRLPANNELHIIKDQTSLVLG